MLKKLNEEEIEHFNFPKGLRLVYDEFLKISNKVKFALNDFIGKYN